VYEAGRFFLSAQDMQHKVRTNYNRELLAQGLGNVICGLVGALPMTGVIVPGHALAPRYCPSMCSSCAELKLTP
jgi:hypothetical protein